MVLEKQYNTTAWWGKQEKRWIIEDRASYRWVDLKGREISKWFEKLTDALEYAIIKAQGENNNDTSNSMEQERVPVLRPSKKSSKGKKHKLRGKKHQ